MKVLSVFCLVVSFVGFSLGQQCKTWISIDPNSYNDTFVDLNAPTANEVRPLGFMMVSVPFEQEVCIVVSGTDGNNRHIEMSYEFEQQDTLCVRHNGNGNSGSCDSSESLRICEEVPGGQSSVTYTFYCSGDGCEGGAKIFWYRFVVEPLEGEQYNENWCTDTRSDEFPSSLLEIPSEAPVPTSTTMKDGGAGTIKGSIFVIAFSMVMACVSFFL